MKYMIIKNTFIKQEFISVTTTVDEINFVSFPVEIGNPNYDQFLEQTGLTDAEVHELEPNVWYDFPE